MLLLVEEERMETFDYRGWPIAYARSGEGDAVVFLHNGGTSHAIWDEVAPRVAQRHQVFALDLLGYGASAKPGTGYTLDNYVGMLGELIDRHGLAPVSLVGNCMGSATALEFARRRPRDVRALVLINPLTKATLAAGELGPTLWLRRRAPKLSSGLYGALGRMRMPGWTAGFALRMQVGSEGRARGVHRTPALRVCHSSKGQMDSLLKVLDDMDSYGNLDRFEPDAAFPPICTVWGRDNRILSAEVGRALNETLRPAREEWLEGCGHLPMLERPEEVAAIIEGFLSENAAAGADPSDTPVARTQGGR
jgi:pimeloyl-ACP methyl ester carboxylesterase